MFILGPLADIYLVYFSASALLYEITFARWSAVNSEKSISRIVRDFEPRYLTSSLNTAQLQWVSGHNKSKFIAWGKSNKIDITVEDIGEDAHLLWMGEKRTDRVILYLHGERDFCSSKSFSLNISQAVDSSFRMLVKPRNCCVTYNYNLAEGLNLV